MEKRKQEHCLWQRGRARGWCRKTIDATNSYRDLCGGCSTYNNEKDTLIEKAEGQEGKKKRNIKRDKSNNTNRRDLNE